MKQALSGLKILDLSMNLPGPYMTWLFAQLGADVLKVENPIGGDYARSLGGHEGSSPLFTALNRNKKSLTLNLKHPQGKRIFLDLLDEYDVLVEGFRPGVMDKLGLGYQHIKERNPKVIYLSITGYGHYDDDYKFRAGHDINYIALAGILEMTCDKEGRPSIPGVQIADFVGGSMFGAVALLAAYIQRLQTGKGQFVDVSMYDGALAAATMVFGSVAAGLERPGPGKMLLNGRFPCYNVYKTKDERYMSFGAIEPKFWINFCKAMEREDLLTGQYADDSVIAEVQEIFSQKAQAEWTEIFAKVDACCEPILELEEMADLKLARNRNMIVELEGSEYIGCPVKLSESNLTAPTRAPELGAHTSEVLTNLGLNEEEISALSAQGAI